MDIPQKSGEPAPVLRPLASHPADPCTREALAIRIINSLGRFRAAVLPTMRNPIVVALAVLAGLCSAAAAKSVPAFDRLPAWFEPAAGGDSFVSRGAEGQLTFHGAAATLRFAAGPGRSAGRLDWRLLDAASNPSLQGVQPRTARSNYFLGRDRSQWRMDVPQYARVQASSVYPGIDLVWYAQGRLLEYDFVVAPGADPSRIRFQVAGAAPRLDPSGDLVYSVNGLEVRQHRPVVYQTAANGRRVPVQAAYRLESSGAVGFELAAYDPQRPLVIDPVFSYAGFLGGVRLDVARAVVIDPQDGGLWIAGSSQSDLSLPEETVTVQREFGGFVDAFIAKIMPGPNGGGELMYWSYFGGTGNDEATAMALGADGAFVITGTTNSLDFPPAGTPFRIDNPQNDIEAFLIRFDPRIEGEFAMTYSTLYGGEGREYPQAVATDGMGKVVIAGYSNSGELPKGEATALQPSNRGGQDIFFALFDLYAPTGEETLVKDSFLGGNYTDIANFAAFDPQGRIVLAGVTMSNDFPLAGPSWQSEIPGFTSAFVAIIDPALSGLDQLVYATYLGGSGLDGVTAGYLGPDGRLWLTGYTTSQDLPVTPGAAQLALAGSVDSFLMVVDPSQAGVDFLKYSTFFGGGVTEVPYGFAVNPATGVALLAGYSASPNFPNRNAPVSVPESLTILESFFVAIDTTATGSDAILYAAQYGGKGRDIIYGATFGADGTVAVVGSTSSDNLPTASPTGKFNPPGFDTGWYLVLAP